MEKSVADEYIKIYNMRAEGEIHNNEVIEYHGTNKGALIANLTKGRGFSIFLDSFISGDLNFIAPNLYGPTEISIKESYIVTKFQDAKHDAKLPFLGFYQPGKYLFNDHITLKDKSSENNVTKYEYMAKDTTPILYALFFNENNELIRCEQYLYNVKTNERVLDCITYFENYTKLTNNFSYPAIIKVERTRRFHEGNVSTGKLHKWIDEDTTYIAEKAMTKNIDNNMFAANYPPVGTYVTDIRYDVSYTYQDKNKSVEETSKTISKADKPIYKYIMISIQVICILVFVVFIFLTVRKMKSFKASKI